MSNGFRAGFRALLSVVLFLSLAACGSALEVLTPPTPTATPGAGEAAPLPTITPAPPAPGRIVFASTRAAARGRDIYVMNDDGSGLARLTETAADETDPAWSARRRLIAFSAARNGPAQIYLIQPDGAQERQLTNDPDGASDPAWSPDGQQLALILGVDDAARLALADVDTGEITAFDLPLRAIAAPAWSPDGRSLLVAAVEAGGDNRRDIFLIPADGIGVPINLTPRSGEDSAPAWSPDGARIAFQSDRGGNADVYVMNADGTAQTPLTDDPGFDGAPTWSHDGSRIAFISERDGAAAIYSMNDSGAEITRLTDHRGADSAPYWRPQVSDALLAVEQMAYVQGDGEFTDILVGDLGRTGLVNLSSNPLQGNTTPDWSPDGARIAYASQRDGNYDIFVRDALVDGADVNLTNHPARDLHPAWSPDGSRIAFESNRNGNWDVWVMNADGSNLQQISDSSADDGNVAWSPDGARIAYASRRDGNFDIFVQAIDGAGPPINLTRTPANEVYPDWSPDGAQIIFRSDAAGTHQIYLLRIESGSIERLISSAVDDDQPAWSPDGTRVAFISNRIRGTLGLRAENAAAQFDIYVYDLRTGMTTLLIGGDGDQRYPDWRPRRRAQ